MGQKPNDAAMMDARIKCTTEECAGSMEQKSTYARSKLVQIMPLREECALSTGPKRMSNHAATKGAQSIQLREECA